MAWLPRGVNPPSAAAITAAADVGALGGLAAGDVAQRAAAAARAG